MRTLLIGLVSTSFLRLGSTVTALSTSGERKRCLRKIRSNQQVALNGNRERFVNQHQRSRILASASSKVDHAMTTEQQQQVVLVIGGCALDRILMVPNFPSADSKVRTSSYHEFGGGGAANTAATLGLLCSASFLSDANLQVKLLTKIGDDYVGQQLTDELKKSGVDVSSPLFRVGHEGSTTSFTSIIVSEKEHTRTCIFTPGTCGELTVADVEATDMEELFRNVVHVHSDTRHTEASLAVAQEARRRNIPVSVDAERDRGVHAFDHLLEAATMIFTSSNQLQDYLHRRHKELEKGYERHPLPDPMILPGSNILLTDPMLEIYAKAIDPNFYFCRFGLPEHATKEVVITKGHLGALHINCAARISESSMEEGDDDPPYQEIVVNRNQDGSVRVEHVVNEHTWAAMYQESKLSYDIMTSGVISEADIVDTTGAGDAFIGGYLASILSTDDDKTTKDAIRHALQLGCWVGGCKLKGVGARSSLPRGAEVDVTLGRTSGEIEAALNGLMLPFGGETTQLVSTDT